jgi:hypothetical protein
MKDIEAYVDAAADAIGLPIAPEHRPGVLRYVELVAAMAPRVMDFELALADEAANVFVPVPAAGSALEPRS